MELTSSTFGLSFDILLYISLWNKQKQNNKYEPGDKQAYICGKMYIVNVALLFNDWQYCRCVVTCYFTSEFSQQKKKDVYIYSIRIDFCFLSSVHVVKIQKQIVDRIILSQLQSYVINETHN